MRAVIGTVISSKPVTLEGASTTLSDFATVATGSRPELAVFSACASRAFAELLDFHRNLLSPHPADAGTIVGDERPSLGTNRVLGVEREIDLKRGKAAVENVSDDRDGKRKKRKERVEVAEGNRSREVEVEKEEFGEERFEERKKKKRREKHLFN